MKKLVIILTVFMIISLCGCTPKDTASQTAPAAVVKLPEDDTVNGYRVNAPKNESSTVTGGAAYYANKNSKTFHYSTCSFAKRIKESNLLKTNDRAELLLDDYKPCSNCNP